ncbi:unnamed protein product [Hyaloperonospora brassicae]|uniref:RxLR effector candidate protein n=1 Tax=Hyaloperonospora brassicae TaxID=162125 RepID=A0AAV0TV31_HYABA|nr:unnamed protein product [Hyaloperonospora brassicae]
MRLVHAVLLPGLVVFLSEVTLLQAHALRGDAAGDPPSGLHDIEAKAVADNESRMGRADVMRAVSNRLTDAGLTGDSHSSVMLAVKDHLYRLKSPRDTIVDVVNRWMHSNHHFKAGELDK